MTPELRRWNRECMRAQESKGRPVRGVRIDGEGARQRPARRDRGRAGPGRALRRRARSARSGRASPTPRSTSRCSRAPVWSLTRRAGARIFYRLAGERVLDLWIAVRDVASEHVAAVEVLADAYLGDRTEVERIDDRRALHAPRRGHRRAARRAPGRGIPSRASSRCGFRSDRRARRRAWPACRRARSSRTAAGPTACTRTTRFASCARTGALRASSMQVSRSGGAQGSRWLRAPERRAAARGDHRRDAVHSHQARSPPSRSAVTEPRTCRPPATAGPPVSSAARPPPCVPRDARGRGGRAASRRCTPCESGRGPGGSARRGRRMRPARTAASSP